MSAPLEAAAPLARCKVTIKQATIGYNKATIRPPKRDRSDGEIEKCDFLKNTFFEFFEVRKMTFGSFQKIKVNDRRNFRFSTFRQNYPMLSYIWIVRSIFSPMLTYIKGRKRRDRHRASAWLNMFRFPGDLRGDLLTCSDALHAMYV